MKIYHNPRCRKSREGVQYLTDKGVKFEIIEYLKDNLSKETIQILLNKLNITALELIRKNEKIWKENYKDKSLSEKELVEVLHKEPKLIERPIIESENLAVIGRPKENIDSLFNN